MFVLVASTLLDEGHLIDAGAGEFGQVTAQFVRRADAACARGLGHRVLDRLEGFPDVGSARLVLAKDVVVAECVAEEFETVETAPSRLVAVRVHRESCYHA